MSRGDTSIETSRAHAREDNIAVAIARRLEAESSARTDASSSSARQRPKQLFLPGMDEFMRAMPNHIARSSLFAPVARGRKKLHKDTVLVSRADAVIRFSGEQLDESQADVWMQAMHEASKHPLGEPVAIRRASFLRSIGRHVGNYEYKWLQRAMEALTFAMLSIEVTKDGAPKLAIGKNGALHLIDSFIFDPESETYMLRVDPQWQAMFANREFALIDWERRLRIHPRQDMARALQRLAATSDETIQRYALDWLQRKLEYTGRPRDFREALTCAMRELERHDIAIIAGGRIEMSTRGKPQAVWTKL